jgi:F0F1-type ATP synthase, subunit a
MKLEISLSPEAVFHIGAFPVTNSLLMMVGVTLFLIVCVIILNRKMKMVPQGFQNGVEMIFQGALDFVDTIMMDKAKTRKVFPFVFSLFIFILIANLVNFIPTQSISVFNGENFVPILRGVMADYGMVFVLTMISFITVQVVGVMLCGPFGYLGKFFNFKSPMNFFVGILELVGEFAKILSLSFRLFGNIFAGEVLMSVFLFLFPFFLPLPFMFLELITAVIQAFVFAVLTLVFIKMAGETAESH